MPHKCLDWKVGAFLFAAVWCYDPTEFDNFARSVIAWILTKFQAISFECDDCVWAAMKLVSFFANQSDTSFDTYLYAGEWISEANFKKSVKKLEISAWQIVRRMIVYASRKRKRPDTTEKLVWSWKSLKKLEKSSWQSSLVVLRYKSSSEPVGKRERRLYLVNWITWRRTN